MVAMVEIVLLAVVKRPEEFKKIRETIKQNGDNIER